VFFNKIKYEKNFAADGAARVAQYRRRGASLMLNCLGRLKGNMIKAKLF
jgi:hypothetical protein